MAFCRCCEPNQTPTYIPPIPRTFKQSFRLSHSPLQMRISQNQRTWICGTFGDTVSLVISAVSLQLKTPTPWMGYRSLFAALDGSLQGWHPKIVPNRLSKVGSFRVRGPLFHDFTDFTPGILAAILSFGSKQWRWRNMLISCGKWWSSHDIYHDIYAMDQCNLYLLVLHKKPPRSPDTWTAGRSFHLEVATPGQIFKAWRDVVRWFGPAMASAWGPCCCFSCCPSLEQLGLDATRTVKGSLIRPAEFSQRLHVSRSHGFSALNILNVSTLEFW